MFSVIKENKELEKECTMGMQEEESNLDWIAS